jgi:formylglycine-generating enzyme required for sulfatase activity
MARALMVVVLALVATGCESALGFEDFQAAQGSTGTGGTGGGGATSCSASGVPENMSPVKLVGGKCVWMDDWEVSRARYEEVMANVDVTSFGDPAKCPSKTSSADFIAGCAAGDAGTAGAGGSAGDLPVDCVDWCDAHVFCHATGKKLCEGQWGHSDDAATSWWFAACSSGGAQDYPYGVDSDPLTCNTSDNPTYGCGSGCQLSPTNQENACKTPAGIFDLVGNVIEWTAECSAASASAECYLRGGNVSKATAGLTCSVIDSAPRTTRAPYFGFRCCWEPSG